MSEYFPKLFRNLKGSINVKVGLSNYAAKTDLKNVTHVDTSSFALKTNLANLITEVDKLDTNKLETVPVDLSKGAYIKYVGGRGAEGFYKFFKKNFVAQETIELNIS